MPWQPPNLLQDGGIAISADSICSVPRATLEYPLISQFRIPIPITGHSAQERLAMAFRTNCSQCGEPYKVADQTRGKMVRCQKCQTAFVATPAGPRGAQTAIAAGEAMPV